VARQDPGNSEDHVPAARQGVFCTTVRPSNRVHLAPFVYPPGWAYRRWVIGAAPPPLFLASASASLTLVPGSRALGEPRFAVVRQRIHEKTFMPSGSARARAWKTRCARFAQTLIAKKWRYSAGQNHIAIERDTDKRRQTRDSSKWKRY
jgi:hypothetical protein